MRRTKSAAIGIALLALCMGAGCSSTPPPGTEQQLAELPKDENADWHWYNTPGLRSVFGDYGKTDVAYVTNPDAAAKLISRGDYLVNSAAACGVCHGAKAGDPNSPLSGGRPMKDRFGQVLAPNITPDKETGIGGWNPFEIMRALRSSIDRQGRPISIDLHINYRWMSDQDAKAIAVYLLSRPPVHSEVERRVLGGFERNTWGIFPQHNEVHGYVPSPMPAVNPMYGRYVASHLAGCEGCHTPARGASGSVPYSGFGAPGGFFASLRYSIRSIFTSPEDNATRHSSEISPLLSREGQAQFESQQGLGTGNIQAIYDNALATGEFPVGGPDIRAGSGRLKDWSEDDIVRYLTNGKSPQGEERERRFCPWPWYAGMTDTDKHAIAVFLKKL